MPLALSASDSTLAALHAFDVAVHALIGPRTKVLTNSAGHRLVSTAPSIYHEMRQSTAAQQGTSFGGAARSLPPVWIDAVDWLREVDSAVASWVEGRVGDTPATLSFLLDWPWTDEHAGSLYDWARRVADFARGADALIDARQSFPLAASCPECSATEVARPQGGEIVRKPALSVSRHGAACGGCGARWEAENLMELALAVGASPLAGVDVSALVA